MKLFEEYIIEFFINLFKKKKTTFYMPINYDFASLYPNIYTSFENKNNILKENKWYISNNILNYCFYYADKLLKIDNIKMQYVFKYAGKISFKYAFYDMKIATMDEIKISKKYNKQLKTKNNFINKGLISPDISEHNFKLFLRQYNLKILLK